MKIVIITAHSNAEIVREVFRAGASGYLLDRCCAAELTAAVHSVLRGSPYITPHVTKDVVSALCGSPVFSMEVVKLTRRQREILRLVAEGHTTKQMGRILEISPRTAEFHKAALSSALGLHTTAELTRYAIEHGLSLPVPDVPAAEDAR